MNRILIENRTLIIVLAGILLLIGLAYGGTKFYLHQQVAKSIDGALVSLQPYADVSYSGISSTLGGELTVDGLRIRMPEFKDEISIGQVGIKVDNFIELMKLSDPAKMLQGGNPPEYFGVIAREVRFPVQADFHRAQYRKTIEQLAPADIRQGGVQCVGKYGHSPRALTALGYQDLVISTTMGFRQDDDSFIAEFDTDIVDMMRMQAEVEMKGSLLTVAMGQYSPILHKFRMPVTDQSLHQRIERYCKQLGLSPAQIERAHLAALQFLGSRMGMEFDDYIIEPYREFINGKRQLVVTAEPRRPIMLSSISQYAARDVPALLNLEGSARE